MSRESHMAKVEEWIGIDQLPEQALLYPGSFNPFHRGHQGLLDAAQQVSGRMGTLELSIINADKKPLEQEEVAARLHQIPAHLPVVVTRAPTFLDKATLFPGAWFALGFDTAVRLLDPRYGADIEGMLSYFLEVDSRFLVAGRLCENRYCSLDELAIPHTYRSLFIPIPEALFRMDISSTQLRSEQD